MKVAVHLPAATATTGNAVMHPQLVGTKLKSMRIAITGSKGMLGSHCVDAAKAQGHECLEMSRDLVDLLDYAAVVDALSVFKPDAVIHSAGLVGGISENLRRQAAFLEINTKLGFNVINASKELGVKKLINFSSSCVYPKDWIQPLREEYLLQGPLEPTNEGYALAKIVIQKLCAFISEDTTYHYKSLVPSNLYGPRDRFDPERSHMIPSVIRKIDDAKRLQNPSIQVWGTGQARREFTYVADVAEFAIEVLDRIEELPQEINVGVGQDYTIDEFYQMISQVVEFEILIEHDLTRPDGMAHKLMDSTRARNMGWEPKHSLLQGLQKTYEYYLAKEQS